jgi:hypothetical protein
LNADENELALSLMSVRSCSNCFGCGWRPRYKSSEGTVAKNNAEIGRAI